MRLDLAGVSASIDARPIVTDVHLTAGPGAFVALIGPNGSGKSTLPRTVYRSLRPSAGAVRLDGQDLWRMRPRHAARHRAVLPQHGQGGDGFSVAEIVATGRHAHKRPLERDGAADRAAVATALERVVVLRDGRVAGHGPPLEVLTPGFIEEVFGVRAYVGPHPITGRPHIAVASRKE
ncbi:ABC transporter ATP-binding protein [Nonomuraea bangladeshensis]|uniref:ABC transporter ATP-binding protein n=1 Tax=Nonomuraea bangladeshensis TaxID=404385 RepID=A0ABV3H0Q7_9ACTN